LRNRYLLISLRLSRLHGNQISCPVSRTIGTPSKYIVHVPPCFWSRTRRFLKSRCSWEPGSSLTTGELSLFCLLPKVSAVNVRLTEHDSYFSYSQNPQTDTFLHELGFAKLRSAAWVWNHQGISKLVNRLTVACQMTASSRFAQSNSVGPPRCKCFALGSSTYPCHKACVSKSVTKDVTFLSDYVPNSTEAPWMRRAIVGADHSASLSCNCEVQVHQLVLLRNCFHCI
jgi:hypothetical protein